MRGDFGSLVGKKIVGVYCRENFRPPNNQLFLVFDDGTYFEIYSYGDMKGTSSLYKGDIETVAKLSFPDGFGDWYT